MIYVYKKKVNFPAKFKDILRYLMRLDIWRNDAFYLMDSNE